MQRAFARPGFALGFVSVALWVLSGGNAGCGGGASGTGQAGTTGAAGGGMAGTTGAAGAAGSVGDAGTTGSAGTSGTTGVAGPMAGTTGSGGSTTGTAGTTGAAGRGGATGAGGTTGAAGRGGTTGNAGTTGMAGTTGRGGTTVTAGTTGAAGAAGTMGTGGTGNEFWVGPNGSDSNAGTQAAPFKTLTAAHARVTAGGTIWLLSGTNAITPTQQLTKSGTASAHIRVQAVAGGTRPLLDFSAQAFGNRGIEVRGDYWELRGFEIQNAGDNCVAVDGSNNTFDQLVIHGCQDTGLQITASSSDATNDAKAANNLVLNCDSYENLDQPTMGENADGFAAKLRIGPGNVFRGCRAWNNADDGWDFFASDDVVTIDNCWAFSNGKVVSGSNTAGDGNGFKLGGAPNGAGMGGAVHIVKNSYAFDNRACGFVRNNNPEVPMLTSCGASGNGTAFCQVSSSPVVTITMTGAQGKAAARNADGSLPAIR